jgi:hypothetical protein
VCYDTRSPPVRVGDSDASRAIPGLPEARGGACHDPSPIPRPAGPAAPRQWRAAPGSCLLACCRVACRARFMRAAPGSCVPRQVHVCSCLPRASSIMMGLLAGTRAPRLAPCCGAHVADAAAASESTHGPADPRTRTSESRPRPHSGCPPVGGPHCGRASPAGLSCPCCNMHTPMSVRSMGLLELVRTSTARIGWPD